MYDNIYLQNRISRNGRLKKNDLSIFDYSLKSVLWLVLGICILIYIFVYFSLVGRVFTIDLFFESIIGSRLLQFLFFVIVGIGLLLYYCFSKSKHSVAYQVYLENDLLMVIFNEGKHIGMEYKMLLSDISNICMYKNGSFSFYSNNIEVDRKGKVFTMKGTIKFIGGDSGAFVSDLQDYLGRKVKFVNKKN